MSAEKRFDWPALQRCLARLHRDAQPFLRRALLIGGGACLPSIRLDPRVRRRLEPRLSAQTDLAATLLAILGPTG